VSSAEVSSAEPDAEDEPSAVSDEDASRLCLSCGICCSGALFEIVELDPGEDRRVGKHLPVLQHATTPHGHFELPCPGHDRSRGCTLYGDRPRTCAGYACNLLRDLRRGEVDLEAALRTAAELRTLLDRVAAALPPGPGWLWQRASAFRHLGAPEAAADRRRHAELLMDLKVLQHLLAKRLDERVVKDDPPPRQAATPSQDT
jgi:hypothetical protein